MEENFLIEEFIAATGLPMDIVVRFMAKLLLENQLDPHNLTVEDLRNLTADYLLKAFEDLPA